MCYYYKWTAEGGYMFRYLGVGLLAVASIASDAQEWLSVLPQDASSEMAALVARQDGLDSLSPEKGVHQFAAGS